MSRIVLTPDKIEVIAPNLKRRLSGVTATIVRLLPLQARSIGIAATGLGLPSHVPWIPLRSVIGMSGRTCRVWHARRNTEMLLGLVLRHVFRKRLKLVFTSASQRHHTRYTRLLISGMDAVVATSHKSASYLRRPAQIGRGFVRRGDDGIHARDQQAGVARVMPLRGGGKHELQALSENVT